MKTVLKIVFKLVLLITMIICCWFGFTPYFRIDHNVEGDLYRNLPSDTVDVLAVGSSHIQYAFNPVVFHAHSGLYSYVLGSSCQPFSMTYNILEEGFKTQHPSVAVIDVFTLLNQSQVCYEDGIYYLAMEEMTGKNRFEAGKMVPDKQLGFQYTFDFFMNHSNWKVLDFSHPQSILDNAKKADGTNDTLGYVAQMPTDFRYVPLATFTPGSYQLSDEVKEEIDRIVQLCRSNNVRPIFIKTPYIIDQLDTDQLNAVWQYLAQKNCEYIDFVAKAEELHWFIGMDGDTWHNNVWGANIISTYLAEYITGENAVTNHQDNGVFDQLLQEASISTARQLLGPENINVYNLLADAPLYPCTIALKYSGGRFPVGDDEFNLMNSLGLKHDFQNDENEDCYAIIQNGKIIQESNESFSYTINQKAIDLSSSGITIDGTTYDQNPGQLEIYIMDDSLTWINAFGITPSEYGFWKKGCLSWDCSNS